MLRRLSILGSLLLAACVPSLGPAGWAPSGYYNRVATKAETAAWRAAQRANTARAYRAFINNYPRSRYVPMATKKLTIAVTKKPTVVRNVPRSNAARGSSGRAY